MRSFLQEFPLGLLHSHTLNRTNEGTRVHIAAFFPTNQGSLIRQEINKLNAEDANLLLIVFQLLDTLVLFFMFFFSSSEYDVRKCEEDVKTIESRHQTVQ